MRLQTILNTVQKFKHFVYTHATFVKEGAMTKLEVTVKPRKNSKAICSGCGKPGSCYDHLEERQFEFVPLCGACLFIFATVCAVLTV